VVVLAGAVVVADMVLEGRSEIGEMRQADGILLAIHGPGQSDFPYVVSTNYSQYNMWYLVQCVYHVKTKRLVGLITIIKARCLAI
jgi:hypothetical protein